LLSAKVSILLLDLDDTIFPTRSIPPEVFEPLFESLNEVPHHFNEVQMTAIKNDLWKYTFHEVAEKYGFDKTMRSHYQEKLKSLPLEFDIQVYDDYPALLQLELPMYLVTSGTTRVQEQKVDALGIREDFIEVHIDDRNLYPGGKKRIFEELIVENRWAPKELLVIGDNILSEIKAARDLSIPWLQIDRSLPSDSSEQRIQSFRDVSKFILT
jgi:putative hydrolase of the HAD superfamily